MFSIKVDKVNWIADPVYTISQHDIKIAAIYDSYSIFSLAKDLKLALIFFSTFYEEIRLIEQIFM